MQKIFLFVTVALFFSSSITSQTKEGKNIRKVLTAQDKAWNNGDIEGFMQTYWKSDSLMFIGKSGITYGWQKTLNNYKKGYPDTAAMGKLRFELIEIKKLSAENYFVVGKWFLTRTIGNINGAFTLLLRKIKNRWVIIADHSS
jgi:ketosteroid isomerase-like protein